MRNRKKTKKTEGLKYPCSGTRENQALISCSLWSEPHWLLVLFATYVCIH